ncbi:MAG: PxxKW family cysteine-rich protein [Syntrophobacteraceae bacterium]
MQSNQLERQPIVEKCNGCANVEGELCRKWVSPATKWRLGVCPTATHVKVTSNEPEQKVRVGQQKQKKKK